MDDGIETHQRDDVGGSRAARPDCVACGTRIPAVGSARGQRLRFVDADPLWDDQLPDVWHTGPGRRWWCQRHLPTARRYCHLIVDEALLRARTRPQVPNPDPYPGRFDVPWDLLQHGWVREWLVIGDEESFGTASSSTDPLSDVVDVAVGLASGSLEQRVVLMYFEPGGTRTHFAPAGDIVRVTHENTPDDLYEPYVFDPAMDITIDSRLACSVIARAAGAVRRAAPPEEYLRRWGRARFPDTVATVR